ncbi:hypothetical protein, partial [Paenibacillus sp.]|uniref:hypothetical protein n=1 Tax=Paenibacillus sp. TaxID=58172 RepID=UPI003463D907
SRPRGLMRVWPTCSRPTWSGLGRVSPTRRMVRAFSGCMARTTAYARLLHSSGRKRQAAAGTLRVAWCCRLPDTRRSLRRRRNGYNRCVRGAAHRLQISPITTTSMGKEGRNEREATTG